MRRHLSAHLDHYGTEHGSVEELLDRLVTVQRQGWAFNRGEWHAEVRAVAAPVHDHTGQVIAAIGIAGPASRFTDEYAAVIGPTVKSIADDFSHSIGYPQAGTAIRNAAYRAVEKGLVVEPRERNVSS
jgi:DNA-binding IclR family transcriptional regulator